MACTQRIVCRALEATLHICDNDGNELPAGSVGNVYFSGGRQFSYDNDAERTAPTYNDKDWSTLGDIGSLDGDDYLYLLDRKSFIIISGGVTVYPQETEDVLVNHPEVLDVAVFGVLNDDLGEKVRAVVQLEGSTGSHAQLESDMIEHCRARLASIKCPKSIEFLEQLPRYTNGKLGKAELRA